MNNKEFWKQMLPLGLSAVMLTAAPLTVSAASPEFSRTTEEWAKLQDQVLEYEELADLVHEYNATVQKNRIDLNEFRKDYGVSKEEVAKRYRELADKLEADLSYPGTGDPDYATRMANIIQNESSIKDLREQADEQVEDYEINRLNYESAEASIVSTAKTHMINYYLEQIQLQADQKNLETQQENLRSAEIRRANGLATDLEVLTAQESIRNAEQAIQSDETAIENYRQRLLVLLGWKHNDTPEIRTIPAVDMARIDAINVEADKAAALENNYVLRVNRRRHENARSADTRETLEKTIRENEQNINANIHAAYQSILSSRTSCNLAEAQADLERRNFETVSRQHGLGNISRTEYFKGQASAETAELNRQIAQVKLLLALENYQTAVNGLANAAASL